MSLNKWINKRLNFKSEPDPIIDNTESIEKEALSKSTELLTQIKSTYGDKAFKVLSKRIGGDIDAAVSYINNKKIQSSINKAQPSKIFQDNFKKSMTDLVIKAMQEIAFLAEADLNKAIKAPDWEFLNRSHSGDLMDAVDHGTHLSQHKAPAKTINWMTDKKKYGAENFDDSGYYSKVVAETSKDNMVMLKPYYRKQQELEECLRGGQTSFLSGWSTIAAKNLFHAADIGDQCEEVYTHEHNGIPLTVHNFDTKSKHSDEFDHSYDPEDYDNHPDGILKFHNHPDRIINAAKISTLDYLMCNGDRHQDNIRFKDDGKFLAIDHEMTHNYPKFRDNTDANTWHGAASRGGLDPYLDRYDGKKHSKQFKDWWNKNSAKIMDSHVKDVNLIKDRYVRGHTYSNFKDRFDTIDKWAKSSSMQAPWKELKGNKLIGVHYNEEVEKHSDNLLRKLPKDSGLAMDALIKSSQNKKLDGTQKAVLRRTAEAIIEVQPPDGIAKMYDKYRNMEKASVGGHHPSYFILNLLGSHRLDIEERKEAFEKLYERHKVNDKYLPPFWAKRMRKEIS